MRQHAFMSGIGAGLRARMGTLARDTRGTSLIETALIAPMLVLLAAGSIDAGLGYARQLKVQQAAARATELATVSGLVANLQSSMINEGAAAAGVPTGNVAIDIWLECDGVRQPNVNGMCTASAPSRFVSITITDTYTPMYAAFFSGGGQSNSTRAAVRLRGFAMVRVQ